MIRQVNLGLNILAKEEQVTFHRSAQPLYRHQREAQKGIYLGRCAPYCGGIYTMGQHPETR